DKAPKLYDAAIAFVQANPLPEGSGDFEHALGLFKAERDSFFGKIVAARAKLASDPAGAALAFGELIAVEDEIVSLAGAEGLAAANDGSTVDVLFTYAKSSKYEATKNACVKGLIQLGVPQATQFLASVIRSQGTKSELGRTAIEKACVGANPDPEALLAV